MSFTINPFAIYNKVFLPSDKYRLVFFKALVFTDSFMKTLPKAINFCPVKKSR